MKQIFILALALSVTSGCVTNQSPQGDVYSAAYVSDRSTMPLEEIVVSLPTKGDNGDIRNLHIFFAAVINPTRSSTAQDYDARGIIQRAHTRIAAEIVTDIAAGNIDPSKGLADLRTQILSKAKTIFDPIYAKWTHAEDLRVDLVLTSLFFTNGSAGKSSQSNRFWW